MGCNTIVECTTAYFGRNVNLLKEISEKAKMNIITNTGWYGAANDRYIPKNAYNMTSEAISGIWVQEWTHGINNTGIKPGFIKLAVDGVPLSAIDKKLVIAGAHAHLKTGLTVQVHTGANKNAAFQQLEAIKKTGMHPSGWIWVHAQNNDQVEPLLYAAKEGAWISLDGVKNDSKTINHTLKLLNGLADAGYMNQVFLSHDGNGFPTGGPVRPFEALMTDFIPKLEMEGYSNKAINLLTRKNPQKAFSVKIRRI